MLNATSKAGRFFGFDQDLTMCLLIGLSKIIFLLHDLCAFWATYDELSLLICMFLLGTFTLSNLGMFGVDRFDAILPPGTVNLLT